MIGSASSGSVGGSVWESAAKLADKYSNQGGIFLRLVNDGDKVVGVFCGEPFTREVVWMGDRYETYDPAIHEGKRPTLRVLLNFFVPAEGAMKVIEGGTVWFKDVLKVRGKYGLDKWSFEIERHGAAGDPKTTYSILPEEKLGIETLAAIEKAGLHDLSAISAGQEDGQETGLKTGQEQAKAAVPAQTRAAFTNGSSSTPKSGGLNRFAPAPDERTVDEATAQEFAAALRELPRADVESFFTRFGLKRVRDLKLSQLSEASAAIGALMNNDVAPF